MQTNSTISLIAAEIAHMKSTINEAEASGSSRGRAAIGPLGSVDDYVARQRALEQLLSFSRPKSAADAGILAAQLSERVAIVRHDYAAPAGIDDAAAEVDRLAAALADWHRAHITTANVSDGGSLIAALVADLEKAWALHHAADSAARCDLPAGECERIEESISRAYATIHALESGIAAARIHNPDDAKIALALLFAEGQADVPGRISMISLALAAYLGDAESDESKTMCLRYMRRAEVLPQAKPAEAEARAVH